MDIIITSKIHNKLENIEHKYIKKYEKHYINPILLEVYEYVQRTYNINISKEDWLIKYS